MKQLLKKVIEYTLTENMYCGMCGTINEMYLYKEFTEAEVNLLQEYIDSRRPDNIEKYGYWWAKGDRQPRIEWLNKQIKLQDEEL